MPIVVYDDCNVREAADHMARHGVGRLPVVRRACARDLVGIITRSDILAVYSRRSSETAEREIPWRRAVREAEQVIVTADSDQRL
jgi:CBS domain-containing protein